MSALVFAGSAQFAATAVLTAGGGAVAAIVAGVLLNARYLPMGIALAPVAAWRLAAARRDRPGDDRLLLGGGEPWRRALRPAFMIGATAALVSELGRRHRDRRARRRPDRRSRRRSASTRSSRPSSSACWSRASCGPVCPRVVAGSAASIAFVLIPFTPAGIPIIAASAAALLGLLGHRLRRQARDERRLAHDRRARRRDRC